MRDDFKKSVKRELAERAGYCCSNPDCRKPTIGPDGDGGSASIGVAAHIAAAAPGGARYEASQTPDDRASIKNGIWLCQSCSRLVDMDECSHPKDLLLEWRQVAEMRAFLAMRGLEIAPKRSFDLLENKLPDLLSEMRADLRGSPFTREFIALSKRWSYSGQERPFFMYYYEEHSDLLAKLQVCERYFAIRETTHNNVFRYEFEEDFVEYLLAGGKGGPAV